MSDTVKADICVIGAGSGGLSVAAGASQMGADVVLLERGEMGGDCLNYGCVPSKSLLVAGRSAHAVRGGAKFGVNGHEPEIDFGKVHAHVHGIIGAIAPHDSEDRFVGLGVNVIREEGRFTGARTIQAGGKTIEAKWFVVATGSGPAAPPIPGLDEVEYLTNETIFERETAPDHLLIIGGGPIGIEMAQAHRRLGCKVTVFELFNIMPHDDPEAVDVVRQRLLAEGVDILEEVKTRKIAKDGNGVAITIEKDGKEETIRGSDLLVAAGRSPNLGSLDLGKAGIEFDKKGIKVDGGLKTTNARVFAIGDAAGSYQFTHMAGYHAGIVIRQMLFRMFWSKVDYTAVPWVTYTDPELAQVGKTEKKAREDGDAINILRHPFAENDRAQAERETDGFIKVVVTPKGKILGATIVGPHAGELLLPWVMAVQEGMKIGKMAGIIAPYPTLSEVSKRAAGSYYTPKLFTDKTRAIVRFLMKFA